MRRGSSPPAPLAPAPPRRQARPAHSPPRSRISDPTSPAPRYTRRRPCAGRTARDVRRRADTVGGALSSASANSAAVGKRSAGTFGGGPRDRSSPPPGVVSRTDEGGENGYPHMGADPV